jgi:RNA polymerase sigma-70 factor (ECF subfamily)
MIVIATIAIKPSKEKVKMNLQSASNTELFRQFVEQGSKEAISIFFQNQTDLFYRVALKYTRNTADAEDVIQSAFINIIDKASQYNGISSNEEKLLRSWCLSVVVQCALMKIRSESSRRNREYKYSNANSKPFDEEKNMDTQLENHAVHQKVKDAIIQLPEKYRIPIHLKYIEGLELDDIANILKLNANTLRSLIKRGLEKVSLQLKDEKVTLSSVGLIGIIEGLPVEHAPIAVKSIASKIFTISHSSRHLVAMANAKTTFSFLKVCLSLVALSFAITIGVFSFKQSNTKVSTPTVLRSESVKEIKTNQVWDFVNEKDRNLSLTLGEWIWNDKQQAMVTRINSFIYITLPIKSQAKPFVVEYVVAPYITVETADTELFFTNGWVRDNYMLGNEYIKINNNLIAEYLKFETVKIYYYKNEVFLFMNNVCVAINRYSQDLTGANASLMTKNYIFKKITSRTFETLPEELSKVIESNSQKKGESRPNLKIDLEEILKDEPSKLKK